MKGSPPGRGRCVIVFRLAFAAAILHAAPAPAQSSPVDVAHAREDSGDLFAAREAWSAALRQTASDPAAHALALDEHAAFLERYRDPAARTAWLEAATAWQSAGEAAKAAAATRRARLLELLAAPPRRSIPPTASGDWAPLEIPGPLRSFSRMTAVSQDLRPEEILTALARNIVLNGYQTQRGAESLEETEYLRLIRRYLAQARELDKLAGPSKTLRVPACESSETGDLLRILGYRMRGGCGSDVVLETVNAPRAFVTTDSGFPLADLEQALRTDKPFTLDYHPFQVLIAWSPEYWITAKEKREGDFLDAFIGDPGLCRFYLGMTKLDPETAAALRKSVTTTRLRALSGVLDFFGSEFQIRDGKALVPGGTRAAPAWNDLVGVSPEKGPEFFERLLARDDGWLASLYDALARIEGPVHDYLTEPARLKRLYGALRGRITTPGPARPVFRSNAEMMLLTTRLHLDPDGRAHIPGGLDVWKELFERNPRGKYDARLSRTAPNWRDPDDVIEALFALCRRPVDNEPLNMFMALSDIDRNRPQPLAVETVRRLVRDWSVFSAQYTTFNDVPTLSDRAILAWLDQAAKLDKLTDAPLRIDAVASLQALTGLWQIFSRQGSIPAAKADDSLTALVAPLGNVRNERDLFDAERTSLSALLAAASPGQPAPKSGQWQPKTMALLAGGPEPTDNDARAELVREQQHIFDAQKLLSLDLLFDIADNLQGLSKGEKLNPQLATRLAARVSEIQLPRNGMTSVERNSLSFGYYVDRHVSDERKVNLRALIDKAARDPEKLRDIRGQLAPMLRDSLVGFNYIHYAPPGAQVLLTNPLFVRGHDFIGMQGGNHTWETTRMYGTGWPTNAGGRLIGSLAGLAYALAEAEQNFLVPSQTQALIWGDLVPQMMLSARAPRFWTVHPAQIHFVGLHMRAAEAMVAAAAAEPARRADFLRLLNRFTSPYRTALLSAALSSGDARGAIDLLTPSEMYSLAQAAPNTDDDPSLREIARLRNLYPDDLSPAAISRTWGTPKPTLANSYRSELLNLRTFPSLMGYSSRMMAESWESNNLFWADIADQTGAEPAQLNVLIPDWTRQVVEHIFASHLEDWPALLRSLREVGESVRNGNTDTSGSRPAI